MRYNVNILEKYIENLVVKKSLLQTTVDAYKIDLNEYFEFLKKRNIDILDTDEKRKIIKKTLLVENTVL